MAAADMAVSAQQAFDTASAECAAANSALDVARGTRTQALADLANALGTAGIIVNSFQHGGYVFMVQEGGPMSLMPAPPPLEDLGGGA